jgi:hypothetical protein
MTDKDLRGIEGFMHTRGDCGHDGNRTVAISDIVLDNEGGAGLTDLGPDGRIKGNEANVASSGGDY